MYAQLTFTQAYLLHSAHLLALVFYYVVFIYLVSKYNIIIGDQQDGSLPLLCISPSLRRKKASLGKQDL